MKRVGILFVIVKYVYEEWLNKFLFIKRKKFVKYDVFKVVVIYELERRFWLEREEWLVLLFFSSRLVFLVGKVELGSFF